MLQKLDRHFQQWQFTTKHQRAFLEDLAMLMADGVPASQAIDTIAEVTKAPSKLAAQSIAESIAHGKLIADGMEAWFAREAIEIVRVGETGGALLTTLQTAIQTLSEQQHTLRHGVGTLFYPLTVIVLAAFVLVFVHRSVLETFAQYAPLNQWPGTARGLLGLAHFIEQAWWLVIIGVSILLYGTFLLLRRTTGSFRAWIDKLPFLSLYRRLVAARFMQLLGLLLENGMVIKQALSIMQTEATPYLRWHLMVMEFRLSAGKENIADVIDTSLVESNDLIRLRVIAKGKSFAAALLSLSRQAHTRNLQSIKVTGRVLAGLLLGSAALLAIAIVVGIYSVGALIAQ